MSIDEVNIYDMKHIKLFEEHGDEIPSHFNESDIKKKRDKFANDCKEKLTGHFKTIGIDKEKKVVNILKNIFNKSISDKYNPGISITQSQINSLCKHFDIKDEEGEQDLIGLIECEFTGE